MKISQVTSKMAELKLGTNRKQYFKTYQRAWASCVHCGSTIKKYKLERHMRTQKCVLVRLAKIKV
jgi:formamidopyrimidine-DNA glycosylase